MPVSVIKTLFGHLDLSWITALGEIYIKNTNSVEKLIFL